MDVKFPKTLCVMSENVLENKYKLVCVLQDVKSKARLDTQEIY